MIPISLVDTPVNVEEFKILTPAETKYALFLGFIIRNEYDNKRLKIAENFKPVKFLHVKRKDNQITECIPLYGVLLTPNSAIVNLMKTVRSQEKVKEMPLITYRNILSQYNFSCDNTYSLYSDMIYPIDFTNLKSVCDDTFNEDKKVFQHLLSLDEKHFDFQSFASLKLLILNI
jgi:hypothetical protein